MSPEWWSNVFVGMAANGAFSEDPGGGYLDFNSAHVYDSAEATPGDNVLDPGVVLDGDGDCNTASGKNPPAIFSDSPVTSVVNVISALGHCSGTVGTVCLTFIS